MLSEKTLLGLLWKYELKINIFTHLAQIFDGPQNIFLCSIFVILFFKLRGLEHKISKLAIKEI